MLSITFVALSVLLISANAQDCSQLPPKGVHPPDCCPGSCPMNEKSANAAECGLSADHGPHGGPGGPGGPPCEAMQCMMKKDGLLTADNKIDKAAFKIFSEQQYSAEWRPAIAKALAACDADTNKADDCEVRRYVFCFRDNIFMNCPASIFIQSADCTALKSFMEKCPRSGPPQ